jgi:CRISPR/Cas system CSM-associated protein Csm3 (group 7 of RAMP superfamily)
MNMNVEFEKMTGFHKLESLWRIEYKVTTIEPFLTRSVSDESREETADILGKTLPKQDLDAVPLVMGDKAILTGNAAKGVFRHLISAQLTQAGIEVCVQEVKVRVPESGLNPEQKRRIVNEKAKEMGRLPPCKPEERLCFVCSWFGTMSRQGALHFSFLKSAEDLRQILLQEPIPMVALAEDLNALIAIKGKGTFALLAPVKENVEFNGWIVGENLSEEVIGAIKEVQDMSGKGFVQFGGFKTRGFGSVKIEIWKIEKYGVVPFNDKPEESYEGNLLKTFLEECQKKYHAFLSRGKKP